jgi:hypothetical protein
MEGVGHAESDGGGSDENFGNESKFHLCGRYAKVGQMREDTGMQGYVAWHRSS